MRFYRRKCLLALIERLQNWVTSLQIQKLMFLLTDMLDEKIYNFMPYKYGCYSMQLSQDLRTLANDGYLLIEKYGQIHKYKVASNDLKIINQINTQDKKSIERIINRFGTLSINELLRYIYLNYPFFAINSVMAKDILSEPEYNTVLKFRPHIFESSLITIGYEGRSLEQFIVLLLCNDVKILCDVRKNAFSQKFGFSKQQLSNACEGVGIRYEHLSGLGIESNKRKDLNTQADYDVLFDEYEATTLINKKDELNHIHQLLQTYGRVALTCFEHNPQQCHRSRIAKKLMSVHQCNYNLINL